MFFCFICFFLLSDLHQWRPEPGSHEPRSFSPVRGVQVVCFVVITWLPPPGFIRPSNSCALCSLLFELPTSHFELRPSVCSGPNQSNAKFVSNPKRLASAKLCQQKLAAPLEP